MAKERLSQFFEFSLLEKHRINGLCKLCKKDYKDANGMYSNFVKHLKRMHSLEYKKVFVDASESLPEINVIGDDQVSADLSNGKDKQNQFVTSVTKNLIIRCNLPLNIVEHHGFRDFLKECNFKFEPASSKRIKRVIIPSLKTDVVTKIYQTLNGVDALCLTIDAWSNKRCRSFLGITCHFVNQHMMPQAFLLDFLRLKSPHTGDNIYQLTEDVLGRFNIKEKVFKIITDNASNMIKAFKFGLFPDDLLDASTDEMQAASDVHPLIDDYDEDIDLENLQMMSIDDVRSVDDDSTSIRLSCFIHSLQLCVRDGLKDGLFMLKVLNKCQIIAKLSHKSSKIADILEQIDKNIISMNITRWNSEFMLVKSILLIGKNDMEAIIGLMKTPIQLTNNDCLLLNEIISVLEPFHDISIKCQTENVVTASLVVPAVVHLLVHLRDIKPTLLFCKKFVEKLQLSIETRFAGIVNRLNLTNIQEDDPFNDPLYFMSTVLDPPFKFYWIRDSHLPTNTENRLKQNIIQLILDEISKDMKASSMKSSNEIISSSSARFPSSTSSSKKRKLFSYHDYDDAHNSNSSLSTDPAAGLDSYLNDPIRSKFSEYWLYSKASFLKKLVLRIFSVQASSAPIERIFSSAGVIFSARRRKMGEEIFKDLVFLKANHSLL